MRSSYALAGVEVDGETRIILVRELQTEFPDAEFADIAVDGELPPLVRAAPDVDGADMRIEIGDLTLRISIEGQEVMMFGLHLVLDLDFMAQDGQLDELFITDVTPDAGGRYLRVQFVPDIQRSAAAVLTLGLQR